MLELQFSKVSAGAVIPTRAYPGDAGLDLYSLEGIIIPSKAYAKINTGITVAIPFGCMGQIVGRSGLAFNNLVFCVHVGTIDYGYTGSISVLLYNGDDEDVYLHSNTRIAQLIVSEIALPTPVEVFEFDSTERGDNGFGSTGMN